MKELTKEQYMSLNKEQQMDYINKFITYNLENFLMSTTSMNAETVRMKAKAMTPIIFENIVEKAKQTRTGFTTILSDVFKRASFEVANVEFVNVQFFLKLIGYKSETEMLNEKAQKSCDYLVERLKRMTEYSSYSSNDPIMIECLSRIGGIHAAQGMIYNGSTGEVNSYGLKQFTEKFLRIYKELYQEAKAGKVFIGRISGSAAHGMNRKTFLEIPEFVQDIPQLAEATERVKQLEAPKRLIPADFEKSEPASEEEIDNFFEKMDEVLG